jgi:hypothetical protein
VWKHTLAAIFPPSPENPLQNQEVTPSAFFNQEQEPQPLTHKSSDSLRKQKRLFPLKPADRFENHPSSTAVSECSLAVQIVAADLTCQPTITTGGMYDRTGQ